jgi:hypothetical protein
MSKETALVPYGEYALAQQPAEAVTAIVKENLGGKGLSAFDLERVKCPAGGGTVLSVPGLEGEEPKKELCGIIIHWSDCRRYWELSIDEGGAGKPPDCASDDGERGIGSPGGACGQCKLAEFGTAKGKDGKPGRGQACKQIQQLFVMTPESLIPLVVTLPPTSLKNSRGYFLRLSGRMMPFWTVITKITLEEDKNEDGTKFSKFKLGFGAKLEPEQIEAIKQIREQMVPHLSRVRVSPEDFQAAISETAEDFATPDES